MRNILAVLLLACPLAAQAPTPRIGWKKVIDEGIVVNTMETRWVNLEQVRFSEYLRSQARERGMTLKTPVHIEIRSDSGVSFAIVTMNPAHEGSCLMALHASPKTLLCSSQSVCCQSIRHFSQSRTAVGLVPLCPLCFREEETRTRWPLKTR